VLLLVMIAESTTDMGFRRPVCCALFRCSCSRFKTCQSTLTRSAAVNIVVDLVRKHQDLFEGIASSLGRLLGVGDTNVPINVRTWLWNTKASKEGHLHILAVCDHDDQLLAFIENSDAYLGGTHGFCKRQTATPPVLNNTH
jgi:hypothetical protein